MSCRVDNESRCVNTWLIGSQVRVFKTGNCDAGQEWKYVALDGGACEDAGMYKAFLVTLRD